MATYVRDYCMTLCHSVAIDAPSKEEAERIFDQLENGPKRWYYLNDEVYEHMGEHMFNWHRDLVNEDIVPDGDVYEDDGYNSEDVIDVSKYIEE